MRSERFKLEKDLHSQYADSSSSYMKNFVAFIAAVAVMFGGYGYVFAYSTIGNCLEMRFSDTTFLWVSAVVVIMLCFLAAMCIVLGYNERKDQIVLHNIRAHYGLRTIYENPMRLKRLSLPEYYKVFCIFIMVMAVAVWAVSVVFFMNNFRWCFLIPVCLSLLAILSVLYANCRYSNKFRKFQLCGLMIDVVNRLESNGERCEIFSRSTEKVNNGLFCSRHNFETLFCVNHEWVVGLYGHCCNDCCCVKVFCKKYDEKDILNYTSVGLLFKCVGSDECSIDDCSLVYAQKFSNDKCKFCCRKQGDNDSDITTILYNRIYAYMKFSQKDVAKCIGISCCNCAHKKDCEKK